MCRDVASFVVGVDRQVEPHEFNKVFVIAKAKHVGVVVRNVLVRINGGKLAVLEHISVDHRRNRWELCNTVHRVFVRGFPVLFLWSTGGVGLGKERLGVECGDGSAELGHRVKGGWEVVQHVFDVLWDVGTSSQLFGHGRSLVWGWNFAGEEKPDHTFREHLGAAWCCWELLLAFEQGQPTVPDAFVRVQDGSFGDHALDATHTAIRLVNSDFTENFGAVLSTEGSNLFPVYRDELGKPFLQAARL